MDGAQITDIMSKLIDPRLGVWLPWVTLAAMIGVDWIKTAVTLQKWAAPAICLGLSILLTFLLAGAAGVEFSGQIVSQGVLMSIVATVLAMGSSALKSRTLPSKEAAEIEAKVVDRVGTETAIAVDRVATEVASNQDAMIGKISDEVVAKIVTKMRESRVREIS